MCIEKEREKEGERERERDRDGERERDLRKHPCSADAASPSNHLYS